MRTGLRVYWRVVPSPAWTNIDGAAVFDVVQSMGLEGVVAKAVTSQYQAGRRSRFWVKTPVRRSGHFVVCGWMPSASRADAVGSLWWALYGVGGALVYCGHVMSGLSDRTRRALYAALSEIGCDASPFGGRPDARDHLVRWVKPLLVGRVGLGSSRAGCATPRGRVPRRSTQCSRCCLPNFSVAAPVHRRLPRPGSSNGHRRSRFLVHCGCSTTTPNWWLSIAVCVQAA